VYGTFENVNLLLGGTLADTDRDLVGNLIARSVRVLKSKIPDLDRKAAASGNYRETVADVVEEMVARCIRGLLDEYESETLGDYSYKVKDFRVAAGRIMVLNDELSRLGVGGLRHIAPRMGHYRQFRLRGGLGRW
jgi:hypothetical protein